MTLIDYLPSFYKNSGEAVNIQDSFQFNTEALWSARNDLLNQLNVDSASTTWGLPLWEKALGIKINDTKPDAERRTYILSRLRGQGTTTIDMIKNVAESFVNGEVTVGEDPAQYSFSITFDKVGIPPNYDDLQRAIEDIKPAHTICNYILNYILYSKYNGKVTHDQMKNYTHSDLRSRRDILNV